MLPIPCFSPLCRFGQPVEKVPSQNTGDALFRTAPKGSEVTNLTKKEVVTCAPLPLGKRPIPPFRRVWAVASPIQVQCMRITQAVSCFPFANLGSDRINFVQ